MKAETFAEFYNASKDKDKGGNLRHAVSRGDIYFIAKRYFGVGYEDLSRAFNTTERHVKRAMSYTANNKLTSLKFDDTLNEVMYFLKKKGG